MQTNIVRDQKKPTQDVVDPGQAHQLDLCREQRKAFGTRVSEVVQTPGISPPGSAIHGPFEKYVGADGTTLWAAATSGTASIGVYLLSCLLARAWDAKQATALWVELVDQRKREIEAGYRENRIISASCLFAARQDISRDNLARWDHSARSWLRRADRAKAFECAQLSLIERNLNLPLLADTSTYSSVLSVWKQAMHGLEALLAGTPIMMSSGSLFLAFSSWHLFPDLIVLGKETTHVRFRDRLFPPGGKGTIGQEAMVPNLSGGLKWSLALSHIRYYGDPVIARSQRDFTRVTFAEFRLVVLGSLFHEWRVSVRDHRRVAQWFVDLWAVLERLGPESVNRFNWLRELVDAAVLLLAGDSTGQTAGQLVQYGQRRAKSFLVDRSAALMPFFGICSPRTLSALSQNNDRDCGIDYLRRIAADLGLQGTEAVIAQALNASSCTDAATVYAWEIATAIPSQEENRKRNADGETTFRTVHSRWLITRSDTGPTSTRRIPLESIAAQCNSYGEHCSLVATNYAICDRRRDGATSLELPATVLFPSSVRRHNEQLCGRTDAAIKYRLVFGDWRLGLYVIEGRENADYLDLHDKAVAVTQQELSPATGLAHFAQAKINPALLSDYLCLITIDAVDATSPQRWSWKNPDHISKKRAPGISMVAAYSILPDQFCISLAALTLASGVYQGLGDATVSLTTVSRPLYECGWLPKSVRFPLSVPETPMDFVHLTRPTLKRLELEGLDLPHSFSCIAMFETGRINLQPADLESTLALCSEASIFVAAAVLSDPFEPQALHAVRRIVGNIGHPGLTLLVAPQEPRIRRPTDAFNVVAHTPYDFKRENNFTGTSLHLSFTEWKFPLDAGDERTIDQDVMVVESVISVLDRGRWVADLNILCIDFEKLLRISNHCQRHTRDDHDQNYDYFSVDCWDELLDAPEGRVVEPCILNHAVRLSVCALLWGGSNQR